MSVRLWACSSARRAPALQAGETRSKLSVSCFSFYCFQQIGESASRSKLTPTASTTNTVWLARWHISATAAGLAWLGGASAMEGVGAIPGTEVSPTQRSQESRHPQGGTLGVRLPTPFACILRATHSPTSCWVSTVYKEITREITRKLRSTIASPYTKETDVASQLRAAMLCQSCSSENLHKFGGEIAIHFPGLKNLDKPHVYVSAEFAVCLDCGAAQFAVPEQQLGQLTKHTEGGHSRAPARGPRC